MKKTTLKKKKILVAFCGAAILALLVFLILNRVAERKITSFLDNEFKTGQLVYGAVRTNLLFGSATIDSVVFRNQNLKIDFEKLEVKGVRPVGLLWGDQLTIGEIHLSSPKIKFRKKQQNTPQNKKGALQKEKKQRLGKNILVENIEVKNGTAFILENQKDTLLYVGNFSAKLDSVRVTSETLLQKIPFGHKNHSFKTDSVYFDLNKYHEITLGQIELSNENISLENLLLRPKYSRAEFRAMIPYEKDMFHLEIASWEIQQPFFDFFADKPVFKSPLMHVEKANFKAYRDKTVADDPRSKKMYSEMLRDLPFRVDIEKTRLRGAFVQYQERIKKDRRPGTVAFYDLNAEIANLTNLNKSPEKTPTTKLSIDTRFMNTSELHVDWQMDVGNLRDYFTISGRAKNIPPKSMNAFFVPAMNIKAKGGIGAVYFNFAGDYVGAKGDMKMDYSGFSVEVIRKKNGKKNKFLSAIANLFVNKNPKNGTVSKQDIQVERDPTKSFWNYFWSYIEKGLLKAVL